MPLPRNPPSKTSTPPGGRHPLCRILWSNSEPLYPKWVQKRWVSKIADLIIWWKEKQNDICCPADGANYQDFVRVLFVDELSPIWTGFEVPSSVDNDSSTFCCPPLSVYLELMNNLVKKEEDMKSLDQRKKDISHRSRCVGGGANRPHWSYVGFRVLYKIPLGKIKHDGCKKSVVCGKSWLQNMSHL